MPARKLDYDYFETGSTARKRTNTYTKVGPTRKNVKTGKNKVSNRAKATRKNNTAMITFILCGFAMAMLITYRYNVISEKNLKTQNLKNELNSIESNLLTSQIEVEQSTDLNKIEAYAKQQLGMQKPDKNQTIYVDTSASNSSVELEEKTDIFNNIIESIQDFINKIF